MSKESDEQLQTTNTHKVADHRVADAGDETDSTAANKASKASLKKEALKQSHQIADKQSFGTAMEALNYLARAFTEWGLTLDASTPDFPPGNPLAEAPLNRITNIFAAAARQAHSVADIKAKADPTDKRVLGPAALSCRGAFITFAGKANAAAAWASKFEHHPTNPIPDMQKLVDSYTTDTNAEGAEPKALDAPGNAKHMKGSVIEDLVGVITADIASAKLGNADDALRITTHVRSLANFSKPDDPKAALDPAMLKHKPDLKKLEASVTALMNDKKYDLSEAVLTLQSLTK